MARQIALVSLILLLVLAVFPVAAALPAGSGQGVSLLVEEEEAQVTEEDVVDAQEDDDNPQGISLVMVLAGLGGVMFVGMVMIGRDNFQPTEDDEVPTG